MKIQIYKSIPDDAMALRRTVFVREQGFVDDPDEIDKIAAHFLVFDESGTPVATCRVFKKDGSEEYILGRFAVVRNARRAGVGSALLAATEEYVRSAGGKALVLHSQLSASDFYSKNGYSSIGSIECEQGRPHIWMMKTLD